jgi:hypothetical protein
VEAREFHAPRVKISRKPVWRECGRWGFIGISRVSPAENRLAPALLKGVQIEVDGARD